MAPDSTSNVMMLLDWVAPRIRELFQWYLEQERYQLKSHRRILDINMTYHAHRAIMDVETIFVTRENTSVAT